MPLVLQDLKTAMRELWHRPAFTATAVLTLAIGMGVNTTAFTVVNGVLFKRPAIATADDVGRIETMPGGDDGGYASLAEYRRFADATRGALDLAAEGRLAMALQHEGTTKTAWVLFVSSNYFSIVDARPLAGRIDVARGVGQAPSVVIGERFWRRTLSAAPLAGLTLRLNTTLVSVAGVFPEAVRGVGGLYSPDVWLPLDDIAAFNTSAVLRRPDQRWLFLFGRRQPRVSVPEVQASVAVAAAAMAREWPDSHAGRGARFRLMNEANAELRGVMIGAALGMAIVGLVLLLACFNVANLLLARAAERERDMAIRAALGANATRLVRLAAVEGFLIAGIACAMAVVLSFWTQPLVSAFAIPIEEPQHIDLRPDASVVAFGIVLTVIAGVLPGLWPALSAARVDILRVLGSQSASASGARQSSLCQWLVGAQIAGSTVFLAIALLFAQSYGRLSVADVGFVRDTLVVAEFEPASHGYGPERTRRYVDALVARVRALPGVADVAVADRVPFFIGFDRLTPVSSSNATCEADACPKYVTYAIGPGYFRTMGIPLAAGREFHADGDAGDVVINGALARLYWPNGGGLGETLRIGRDGRRVSVIGISAGVHTRGLDRERPALYVPLGRERFEGPLSVVARTATIPELFVRPITEAAQALDANVSMLSVKTMRERMSVQLWPFRTISWFFSICGVLALGLGTVGLAAVVIHMVNRRLREFGVRLSMGATPRHLVGDVLGSSGRLLVPGLVTGILLAAAAARMLQSAFIGVNVLNPTTYLAVAMLQCAVVAAASIAPALRASRVDPLIALRAQ